MFKTSESKEKLIGYESLVFLILMGTVWAIQIWNARDTVHFTNYDKVQIGSYMLILVGDILLFSNEKKLKTENKSDN